jgi:hypothetical protein
MNKIKIVVFLMVLGGCTAYKNYLVYNESMINVTYMKNMKFDIETFNKNNKNGTYEYIRDNIKITQQKGINDNDYVEYIEPIGKFYNVLNVYYLNGNLKKHGIRLNEGHLLIKKWEYYDEAGHLIREEDEEAKFRNVPFDYNKVFLWLDRRGFISIKEGKVYMSHSIAFISEKKVWRIDVFGGERKTYTLSGKNGDVLSVTDINAIY